MRVTTSEPFVDIHCHLLPGIDDGARDWADTLAMAQMATEDGIATIIVTPHQLGSFGHNRGDDIRALTQEAQRFLNGHGVPLRLLPGADVRIEDTMVEKIRSGDVLTLGDHRRHVLLELPHEMYFPLEPLLTQLAAHGLVGILSHPERNLGILQNPGIVGRLVEQNCLMQLTAGSLLGAFGTQSQACSEMLLRLGWVHFVSTDAHGPKSRRPLLGRALGRVAELTDRETAAALCCHNPAKVAAGEDVAAGAQKSRRRGLGSWLGWKRAS